MTEPAGPHTIRQHNLALVLAQVGRVTDRVADTEGISRAQLAATTGLTKATVSALVDELITNELLVELELTRGGRGRPASPVRLNPDGPGGLGVEINVDYIRAVVVDLTGRVRARLTLVGDNRQVTPRTTIRRAADLALRTVREAARGGCVPVGAVLAVPGLVDERGRLVRAPNLPGWTDLRVAAALGRLLRLPLVAENEANLSARAEYLYGAERREHFIHISGEVGVGAGIVIGGRLYRGVRGYAGEIGHVVVEPDGRRCSCGSRGCLEQLAGQEALLRGGPLTLGELAAEAATGVERATRSVRAAGRALGVALAGVVNVLDVPTVILGGRYADLGRWLVEPITEELAARVVSGAAVEVLASTLGTDAAALGAAGTVIDGILAAVGTGSDP